MKSYDLSDIFAAVDTIDTVAEECDDDISAADKLVKEIMACKTKQKKIGYVHVYQDEDAVIRYLQWFIRLNATGTSADCMDMLLSDMSERFWAMSTPILDLDKIQNILAKVNVLFAYSERVLKNCPLDILIIDAQHDLRSAETTASFTGNGMQAIMRFYRSQNDGLNPAHIFLHELGHLLHMYLTKTIKSVPDSFSQYLNVLGVDTAKLSPEQLPELFADAFLMAVISQCNDIGDPFPEVAAGIKQLCFSYISRLFELLI